MPEFVETKAMKKDKLFIFLLPIVLGVVGGFGLKYIGTKNGFIISETDGLDDVKIMLTIWVTILGFLITAISILVALGNDRFIEILKGTGHFATILYSYGLCCIHMMIAIILAIISIFAKIWTISLFYFLCGLTIDTLTIVAICLFFLLGIIGKMNRKHSLPA